MPGSSQLFQIGAFSLMSRLSVKALRFYQKEGLLEPEKVDPLTGYRYYSSGQLPSVALIASLKDVGLTLAEIKEALPFAHDSVAFAEWLKGKKARIDSDLADIRRKRDNLTRMIERFASPPPALSGSSPVEAEGCVYLGIRYSGRYDQIGEMFSKLFRIAGRSMSGPPFALYHDLEYKDDHADITASIPLLKQVEPREGAECLRIEPFSCVSATHEGSYETIGSSYAQLFTIALDAGLEVRPPIRETYLRGPGSIRPDDPSRYITKIEIPILKKDYRPS